MKPEVKLLIDDYLYLSFTKVEEIDDMCSTLQKLRNVLKQQIQEEEARRQETRHDRTQKTIGEYEKVKTEFEQLPEGIKEIFRPFFDAIDDIVILAKNELNKTKHE